MLTVTLWKVQETHVHVLKTSQNCCATLYPVGGCLRSTDIQCVHFLLHTPWLANSPNDSLPQPIQLCTKSCVLKPIPLNTYQTLFAHIMSVSDWLGRSLQSKGQLWKFHEKPPRSSWDELYIRRTGPQAVFILTFRLRASPPILKNGWIELILWEAACKSAPPILQKGWFVGFWG